MKKVIFSFLLSFLLSGVSMNAQFFSDDFENDTPGNAPSNWTSYTTQSDDPGFVVIRDSALAHSPQQIMGHLGVNISQTSESWIVTPAITVGSNQEFVFYWRMKWSYAYDYTGVYISTGSNDPINNPSDFTELEEFDPASHPTWNEWNKASYDLRPYDGQTVYIAFKYVGDFAHDFYVDDFEVRNIPYCNPPIDLQFDSSTDTTATVSWQGDPAVDEYDVVWGPVGFNPDSVAAVTVTGTTYTITGLEPATWYDVYVRTHCSSYNSSAWSGPAHVRTTGPVPVNDTCGGAIALTVYPYGGSAGNETIGDTYDATPSPYALTSCDSYGTNLDLFYTFTAPADGNVVILTGGLQGDLIEAAIYDSCGGNELFCFSPGSARKIATGLTPGQDYVLQVWHDDFNKGQFTIALEETPPLPPNNDCSGAIDLTVYPAGGGAGNETNGDTSSATPSSMSQTSCDSYGTNLDLFYSFVAPASGSVQIIRGGATGDLLEAAIYDGCHGNELACYSSSSQMLVGGLTPGQTYILQVWHDDNNAGPFTIVLEEGPSGPPNDTCAGAIDVPVTTDCSSPVIGDNTSASDSSVGSPGCANYQGGDIWFRTVIPATGGVVIKTMEVSGSDVRDTGMAVYEGDCSNLSQIDCDDDGGDGLFSRIAVTGRTPGDTLYIRVWEYGNDSYGQIGVCVTEVPNPPANDDCANAETLTVYPEGGGSGNETNANTLSATASTYSHTSCDNTGTNLDLFYTFTAPAGGNIAIITGGEKGNYVEAAIYDTCGGTELECFGRGSYKVTSNLTAGQTYILQVWHDDSQAGPFTIVLEEAPAPPVNDDCSGAIELTVTSTCNPVYVNNIAATDSGVPDPGCANYSGGDLWFKAVIPADGNLDIETQEGTVGNVWDTGMAAYEGDCNNLTLIECNDDGGTGLLSKISLTGRTPGDTIYIRVWEYGNNNFGEIGVCAYNPNISVEELEALGFSFHPNPATDMIYFQSDVSVGKVQILGLTGQLIMEINNAGTSGQLDISALQKGVYLMKVHIDGKEGIYRIIKN